MGIEKEPVVATFALALPDTEPNRALEIVATFAGPPEKRPASFIARRIKPVPPPVAKINAPKKTKIAITLVLTPTSKPHSPPVVRKSWPESVIRLYFGWPKVPGIKWPNTAYSRKIKAIIGKVGLIILRAASKISAIKTKEAATCQFPVGIPY